MNIFLVSLGCPRNLSDSEVMLGLLTSQGHRVCDRVEDADVIIVNTCAFIKEAEDESYDAIEKAVAAKREGKPKCLIVAGCLSAKYKSVLAKKSRLLSAIDAFIGPGEVFAANDIMRRALARNKGSLIAVEYQAQSHLNAAHPHYRLTMPHFAYLKITEGCSNRCSYCVIPDLRGPHKSRPLETLVEEAKAFARTGAKELILVGQDTTRYGIDIYGRYKLDELLSALAAIPRVRWIRLLYAHPAHLEDSTVKIIARGGKICRYIDLPIQHFSDTILRRMHRGYDQDLIRARLNAIRRYPERIALRTSVIVGFPGETKEDFEELCAGVRELRFERLGCFTYSRERNTKAYAFKPHMAQTLKQRRFKKIMEIQEGISREVNARFLGDVLEVIIDEQKEKNLYLGRTRYDAPEVDGVVYVHSKKNIKPSDIVEARIRDTYEYDLVGEVV